MPGLQIGIKELNLRRETYGDRFVCLQPRQKMLKNEDLSLYF